MKDYAFHDPLWLLALLILPLLIWVRGRRGAPVLVVPFAAAWHRPSLIPTSRWPAALALTGLILLIGALARPQIVEDKREVKQQGYDLMLAIDLSGSMLAEDYERGGERINRLQAIKPIIQAFIKQRTSDRIGMVVFSGRAYTLAPLTFDHDWLERQVERLKLGIALIAVGAIVHAIFVALRGVGEPGNPFWTLLDPALTLIRWSFMPLGSALIGAAIVIKELGPSSTEQRVER